MLPLKYKLLFTMSVLFFQVEDRAQIPLCSLLVFPAIVLIVLKVFWIKVYKGSYQGYWPALMEKCFFLMP